MTLERVCVFCGSSSGRLPAYAEAARAMGAALARRGITLVFGAGNVGLMGSLADACLAAGGRAIGVIPGAMVERELAHRGLTELRIVRSMHERKAMMADLADAFVAMPGGFGTFEELCEILTWAQLGIHEKPVGLLNVSAYYAPLLSLFDHAVSEGLLRHEHRAMLVDETDPDVLLDRFESYVPPHVPKWLDWAAT